MVIAGVLMGSADSHFLGLLSWPALLSYALVVVVIAYILKTAHALWKDRRENAFDSFYTRDAFPYYKDEAAVKAIFFKRNPMPFWSIFRKDFDVDDPTPEELERTLSVATPQPPSTS
jgi:hypothetical protein